MLGILGSLVLLGIPGSLILGITVGWGPEGPPGYCDTPVVYHLTWALGDQQGSFVGAVS